MNDPCKECLVQPCCTKVCWNKENYITLLKQKEEMFGNAVKNNQKRFFQEYRKTINKKVNAECDVMKIKSRTRA